MSLDLPPSGPQPDGAELVRVLSYNIRSQRDDRAALVRVIRACEPDLVCVQESPRYWRPEGQAAWLARRTGTVVLSGGGRTAAGPLLLGGLRVQVVSRHDLLLPKHRGWHARGFATSVVRLGRAVPFALTSCHLSFIGPERVQQFELLREQAAIREHSVIAGDFNEHPEDPGWGALAERYQDGWATKPWGGEYTSRPGDPLQRLDAVFASPGIEVLSCGVPPLPVAELLAATDHLPVVAVLRVPAAS
ncbi:endonuclease/exonuclease/phosphatase family protein [Kitasatospora sp. NBC_01287]|uniref:endonuclease/exonuclease/phosphatase family protein n=1 Tax=Kitasatospora sp. NBC_01287 TaxID=2903573 RepID=UPI00224F12C3|nr:endonuclease/exonuclease/phosphatase family protein [Kitasatospora sp. NBC_01287]MCX4749566.1 endonuclease/exonuclease/phosphatase family protein [Kitasatospora sp. NBC_01287]